VGLWGESQVSNDFPKIVDKIPDDRGWNRGKPGPIEVLESLFALVDYCSEVATHAPAGPHSTSKSLGFL